MNPAIDNRSRPGLRVRVVGRETYVRGDGRRCEVSDIDAFLAEDPRRANAYLSHGVDPRLPRDPFAGLRASGQARGAAR